MSEKPRGTLSLPKRTILDDLKPEPVEVCDSCKTVVFKFQCHAFKSELSRYKLTPYYVATYGLSQSPQGFNQVSNGNSKAGFADVHALVSCIRKHFGSHESDLAKKRIESLMILEHLKRAAANIKKQPND